MTASTTSRRTAEVDRLRTQNLTVNTSATLYQGCLVALNAAGLLVDATEAATDGPYYVATGNMAPDNPSTGTARFGLVAEGVLSSAAAGTRIEVATGLFWLANGSSIADTDIGAVAYCDDNQTVKLDGAGTAGVGIIRQTDSVLGVLVEFFSANGAIPDGSVTAAKIASDAVDSDEIVDGAVDPVHLASGARTVAAGGAVVIAESDRFVRISNAAGGALAVTMTATHAGHRVVLHMTAGDGTHYYTAAVDGGAVTLNAAKETTEIYYDGAAWRHISLMGATFA